MSFNKYATVLAVEPHPSRYLGIYLVSVHGLALLASLIPSALPWAVRVLLVGLILLSFVRSLSLPAVFGRPPDILRLQWLGDEDWRIHFRTDTQQRMQILPGSVVLPWLMVLCFQAPQGKRRFVLLAPDMLDADSWRRLRVKLKYARLSGSVPDQRA